MLISLRNKRNKGFSLLEILLVLAIAASVVAAAFVVYPKAQTALTINKEAKNIAMAQAGIRSMYSSVADYSGLTTELIASADIFPEDMIREDSYGMRKIVNYFGGDVIITPTSGISGKANSAYNIKYFGLQTEECIKLGTSTIRNVSMLKINDMGLPYSNTINDGIETTISSRCKRKSPATIEFVGQ